MKQELKQVPTPEGHMDTYVTHPDKGGPFPAVVIYMDIWGLRQELYDIASRIATVGYYVMVPNLYHREGNIRFDYRDEKGKMLSLVDLDEETKKKVLEPHLKITNAMVMEDTKALIDFISQNSEPAKPDQMGSIGYCLGGRMVLCASGTYPENFKAGAALHGTLMASDAEDSPHKLFDRFQGEVYFGYGSEDRYTPPELRAQIEDILKDCSVRSSACLHEGAHHGYALPDRNIYDRDAAERDWEHIFAMFHRQIPPAYG